MQLASRRSANWRIGAAAGLFTLGLVMAADGPAGQAQEQARGHGYSRPARSPHGSRSEVIAPHGMVAASQPLAAQVGLDILKAGGNAVDAAVAVNAMLGLVEPHMNGVGGDLFALVWHADTERLYALNATGRAPHAISRETLIRQGTSGCRETARSPGRFPARSTAGSSSWTASARWRWPTCWRRPSAMRAAASR